MYNIDMRSTCLIVYDVLMVFNNNYKGMVLKAVLQRGKPEKNSDGLVLFPGLGPPLQLVGDSGDSLAPPSGQEDESSSFFGATP